MRKTAGGKERTVIEIYEGDGKGKTTAAVGLAVRAAGRGVPVLFAQFLKDGSSGEVRILRTLPEVTVASELFDEAYTSLYKMTTDNGPVLSFDTNNYAFHYFATPSGSSRNLYGESGLYQAYKGDFEFMILSATADEVVLKGLPPVRLQAVPHVGRKLHAAGGKLVKQVLQTPGGRLLLAAGVVGPRAQRRPAPPARPCQPWRRTAPKPSGLRAEERRAIRPHPKAI